MFTPLRCFLFGCVIVFSLMQAACGQKGDLYLPDIPAAPNVIADRPPGEKTTELDAEQPREQKDEKSREASVRSAASENEALAHPEAQDIH